MATFDISPCNSSQNPYVLTPQPVTSKGELFRWLASKNTCISKQEQGQRNCFCGCWQDKGLSWEAGISVHTLSRQLRRKAMESSRSRLESFSMLASLRTLMLHTDRPGRVYPEVQYWEVSGEQPTLSVGTGSSLQEGTDSGCCEPG